MSSPRAALLGASPQLCRRHRRRRPPTLPPSSSSSSSSSIADVFVTTRTDFRAQLRRCQRLLAPPEATDHVPVTELRLHGLGLAVPRAVNLALQLQAAAPGLLRLHVTTSSVILPSRRPPRPPRPRREDEEDDEDEEDEVEEEGEEGGTSHLRHNSAIQIRVCREAQ
ncbi:ribonuclease P protein subunit p20 [Phaenicophaeus curvirostris]|uniref:ribonuclease P protein subunit p20 n=1 Tax=Phaenicophaeus curvirostris TaxID=33595 RepID=UPI0037F0FD10